ncbi:uncharacterized protein LOC101742057 [Bombyx mori]|uniref:Uncharacterized protein n=1 Tax=Bombyx mori TaxID=7091 RepID=A0A8R1WMS6_BOMMO|nr:uncharacterized protein LOC101742057 [Bombyx mori]
MTRFLSFMVLITWATMARSECIQFTFESGIGLYGNDSAMCSPFPIWNLGTYSSIEVETPHVKSTHFVEPNDRTSCFTSPKIQMENGGRLEINVFVDSVVGRDISLSVVVSENVPNGVDSIVAVSNLPQSTTPGWHVLSANIVGSVAFEGYVNFIGHRSTGSHILIDAIRYIPPHVDVNDCVLYEDDETTPQPEATTPEANDVEECITFNFEENTEKLFDDNNYLCDGFVPWNIGNYANIRIESQNVGSEKFLTPNQQSSCTASFAFPMTPGGVIEANVYVDHTSNLDHVIILVKNLVSNGVDTVAGFQIFEPSRASFVTGWSVIRIPIANLIPFNGYLVFLGAAAEGSKVLVDSFRYIPPGTPADHESCAIY